MYHSCPVSAGSDPLAVPRALVDRQWRRLRADGWILRGLTDALAIARADPDARVVGLTFDDAYADFLGVLDLLAECEATATVYVSTGDPDGPRGNSRGADRSLGWDELAALVAQQRAQLNRPEPDLVNGPTNAQRRARPTPRRPRGTATRRASRRRTDAHPSQHAPPLRHHRRAARPPLPRPCAPRPAAPPAAYPYRTRCCPARHAPAPAPGQLSHNPSSLAPHAALARRRGVVPVLREDLAAAGGEADPVPHREDQHALLRRQASLLHQQSPLRYASTAAGATRRRAERSPRPAAGAAQACCLRWSWTGGC